MTLSVRLLAISTLLALAPVANAGGLDAVKEENQVVIPTGVPVGSLGGGGGAIVAGVLALALIAAASGSSGSH